MLINESTTLDTKKKKKMMMIKWNELKHCTWRWEQKFDQNGKFCFCFSLSFFSKTSEWIVDLSLIRFCWLTKRRISKWRLSCERICIRRAHCWSSSHRISKRHLLKTNEKRKFSPKQKEEKEKQKPIVFGVFHWRASVRNVL